MSVARFGIVLLIADALIAGVMSVSALAQPNGAEPPPGCKAWDSDLPAAWAPWAQAAVPVTAGVVPANAATALAPVGRKVSITLAPAKTVRMAVETPDADPPPNAHKGILALHVPADGVYWVALSESLWVDVVASDKIVESSDHGPGPHCASVRKAVQFPLKAGDAFIQLSDNNGPKVDLMVVRQQ
jgi:hypothetical protein